MKQEVKIIKGPCDYLEEDILEEYDLSHAKFYHSRENMKLVEIEPDVYNFFGSPAKINHILKSIKETMTEPA